MQMASSAKRTCSELRSASLYTATVLMPSSLHAQMTRRAISPRLAMRIFRNMENFIRRGFTRIGKDFRFAICDLRFGSEYGFLIREANHKSAHLRVNPRWMNFLRLWPDQKQHLPVFYRL